MANEHFALVIERMPQGGFVVTDGSFRTMLFASTTIGEALSFVASKLAPSNQEDARLRSVGVGCLANLDLSAFNGLPHGANDR